MLTYDVSIKENKDNLLFSKMYFDDGEISLIVHWDKKHRTLFSTEETKTIARLLSDLGE